MQNLNVNININNLFKIPTENTLMQQKKGGGKVNFKHGNILIFNS